MKMTVIGAGSHFTHALVRALYQAPDNENHTLNLFDIREGPLKLTRQLIGKLNEITGRQMECNIFTDRETAVRGADHVLAAFAIDFPNALLRTFNVMKNHGMLFVEGETASPGALMATLRHLPPLMEIAEEMKKSAPGAWLHVINNPMSRLVHGLIYEAGYTRVAGHCHGTMHMKKKLGEIVEVNPDEIDFAVSGINHFHIVQRAVHTPTGRDLLAELHKLTSKQEKRWQEDDFTQWRIFKDVGYCIGHGIWHNFDYTPYANIRLMRYKWCNTWPELATVMQAQRKVQPDPVTKWLTDDGARDFLAEKEHEQIYAIMSALSGQQERYFYLSGNMPNNGHIPELPEGAIVELPAWVDNEGIALIKEEKPLPKFFAQWLQLHLAIHRLSVEATVDRSRRAAIEAIALDPCFRDCNCSPAELLDDMLAANEGSVPELS